MRMHFTAAVLAVAALIAASTSVNAAASHHWYCTSDGIKSWTSDASMKDAAGWTYTGDRAAYHDGGTCKHG